MRNLAEYLEEYDLKKYQEAVNKGEAKDPIILYAEEVRAEYQDLLKLAESEETKNLINKAIGELDAYIENQDVLDFYINRKRYLYSYENIQKQIKQYEDAIKDAENDKENPFIAQVVKMAKEDPVIKAAKESAKESINEAKRIAAEVKSDFKDFAQKNEKFLHNAKLLVGLEKIKEEDLIKLSDKIDFENRMETAKGLVNNAALDVFDAADTLKRTVRDSAKDFKALIKENNDWRMELLHSARLFVTYTTKGLFKDLALKVLNTESLVDKAKVAEQFFKEGTKSEEHSKELLGQTSKELLAYMLLTPLTKIAKQESLDATKAYFEALPDYDGSKEKSDIKEIRDIIKSNNEKFFAKTVQLAKSNYASLEELKPEQEKDDVESELEELFGVSKEKETLLELANNPVSVEELSSKLHSFQTKDVAKAYETLTTEERQKLYPLLGTDYISEIIVQTKTPDKFFPELHIASLAEIENAFEETKVSKNASVSKEAHDLRVRIIEDKYGLQLSKAQERIQRKFERNERKIEKLDKQLKALFNDKKTNIEEIKKTDAMLSLLADNIYKTVAIHPDDMHFIMTGTQELKERAWEIKAYSTSDKFKRFGQLGNEKSNLLKQNKAFEKKILKIAAKVETYRQFESLLAEQKTEMDILTFEAEEINEHEKKKTDELRAEKIGLNDFDLAAFEKIGEAISTKAAEEYSNDEEFIDLDNDDEIKEREPEDEEQEIREVKEKIFEHVELPEELDHIDYNDDLDEDFEHEGLLEENDDYEDDFDEDLNYQDEEFSIKEFITNKFNEMKDEFIAILNGYPSAEMMAAALKADKEAANAQNDAIYGDISYKDPEEEEEFGLDSEDEEEMEEPDYADLSE